MGNVIIPNKPLIVVDLSAFRSWKRDYFPDNFDVILPKTFLFELPTSDNGYKALIEKLFYWLRKYHQRVWVGKLYFEIASLEKSAKIDLHENTYIDFDDTENLWAFAQGAAPDLQDFERIRGHFENSEYIANRTNTVRALDEFLKIAKNKSTFNSVSGKGMDPNGVRKAIFLPTIIFDMLGRLDKKKTYASEEWEKALSKSPLDYAMGRWTAIMLWLCCRWITGVGNKPENHLDDAHYVLTASYAGKITTKDEGMKQMIRDVFPDCGIFDLP